LVNLMGSLGWLLEDVRTSRVFKRNKVSLRHKVRACVMYMAGLSYRAMTERTGLIPASHVAVHYWIRSLRRLMRVVKRRERKVVAVDRDEAQARRRTALRLGRNRRRLQGGTGLGYLMAVVIPERVALPQEGEVILTVSAFPIPR